MPNRSLLHAVLLLVLAAGPAHAQGWPQILPGIWTADLAASCRTKSYAVTVAGNELRFRDQDGRVNVETIIGQRADGILTETALSSEVPAGTRWEYSIVSADELRVRNLASGRPLVLTRCLEGKAAVPGGNGTARSTAFIQQYFATWSSDNGTALAFVGRSYAPEVSYYGKPTSRAAVLATKSAFTRRWPSRSYVVEPGSVRITCNADASECGIAGTVDWTCRSAERHAESSGSALFALQVAFRGDAAFIVQEGGAVTSRGAQASLPSPPLDPVPRDPVRLPVAKDFGPALPEIEVPPVRR